MFWPVLRTAGSSRTGRRMSRARSLGIWAGAPEVVVADGDVEGLSRDEGKGQPDEPGPGRGGAVGFRVQGHFSGRGDPGGQRPELVLLEDRVEFFFGREPRLLQEVGEEGGELELLEKSDGLLLVGLLDGVTGRGPARCRGRGSP